MLVQGLGASALPYCMIAVGGVVLFITPAFSAWAHHHSPTFIMFGLTAIGVPILSGFAILLYSGVALSKPSLIFPAFFIAEETLVTLLMLVYWQIAMVSFSKEEAKRLIGIVSMGAAFANIANGWLVGQLIAHAPGGSYSIVPLQIGLLLIQLLPNYAARMYVPQQREDVKEKVKLAPEQRIHRLSVTAIPEAALQQTPPWHASTHTRMMAVWAFAIVTLFTSIEFEYSAVLGVALDADQMARGERARRTPLTRVVRAGHRRHPGPQCTPNRRVRPAFQRVRAARCDRCAVTANLASLAGIGQIVANLVLTPLLLQRAGVAVALLVTPAAYAVGQALVLSAQSVDTVFVARALDFVLRYTVNGNRARHVPALLPRSRA
eukprot:4741446-Prymnesium_polylepis.1